jgi:micrococcal nuclease
MCRAPRRLVAAVALAMVLAACTAPEATVRESVALSAIPDDAQRAVVERVVDGDTLWVRVDEPGGPLPAGTSHKIRLLEIDTPEAQGAGGVECGAAEATAYAEKYLLVGSTVHLVADREDRDRYDRFLRYLWTDEGMFFNLEMVRHGLARAVLFEPNDAYIDLLRTAEAVAQDAGAGIWGELCDVR